MTNISNNLLTGLSSPFFIITYGIVVLTIMQCFYPLRCLFINIKYNEKIIMHIINLASVIYRLSKRRSIAPPDGDGVIWLRKVKSLSLIKKTLRGNWKIHYQYGGLTGHQKTDLTNSWFRFLDNDSMYIIFEGNTYAATKPNFVHKQTEFGFDSWILDFEFNNAWGLRDEWVIDVIIKDSLWMGFNTPDPLSYNMTRFP